MNLKTNVSLIVGAAVVSAGVIAAPTMAATPAPVACPATPGVTSNSVKMGVLFPRTGVVSSFYVGFDGGVQLRLDQENAKGGVYGRKIVTSPYDDQSSGQLQPAAFSKAIDQDGMFGLLLQSGTDAGFPYAKSNGIPIVGPPQTTPFSVDRNAIGTTGPYTSTVSSNASIQRLKAAGATKIAVISSQASVSGTAAGNSAWAIIPSVPGMQQTLRITDAPPGSFDATSMALRIKNAGVDGLNMTTVTDVGLSILQALKNQNYPVKAYTVAGILDPAVQKQAGSLLDNGVGAQSTVPLSFTKIPAVRTYVNGLKARGVNALGIGPPAGYLAADLFLVGLKLAGKCPTRASFIDAVRNITKYTAGGLLGAPVSFKPGTTPNGDPPRCTWYQTVNNGISTPDKAPTCGQLVDIPTGKVLG